ncbi:response regulator transcription factor [Egibacter rhizosphaerae]|uniref:Response regulator transcription factor n=1 Tax=Egibacter rhizosphaerae TaxID=1670831 RepID=A0A411YCW8_9ACTN|nr:response regulator transcription factor [Egibacter rhizosphaerae]QBI19038.1 response regulator transcription factor [Egibacter rhizosphaerae]
MSSAFGPAVQDDETGDSTPAVIRVVIAEDHGVVADGIATMLSFEEDLDVLSIVDSGEDLVSAVRTHQPDVALVDINLVGMDGLTAVRTLNRENTPTRAMALTMFTDHDTVTRAVAAGVAGYLPKNVRRQELVQAVRAVAAGKGFLHPDVTRPFLDRVGPISSHSGITPLSEREQEVLEELAKGSSTREIASELGLGDETVKSHLSRIYQKLRAQDRVQAVVIAMRHGLVQ